jgi:hypothetical protein
LNGTLFNPLTKVKWLGVWFQPSFSSHHHYQQRFTKALHTFNILKPLSSPGSGLTGYNARRLAQAVILPSLLYGSAVFTPNAASFTHLNSLWTRVLRWITNCFYSTNRNVLFPEAALMPLESYCAQYKLQFAKRIALASPKRNPVTARLPTDFPTPDHFAPNPFATSFVEKSINPKTGTIPFALGKPLVYQSIAWPTSFAIQYAPSILTLTSTPPLYCPRWM